MLKIFNTFKQFSSFEHSIKRMKQLQQISTQKNKHFLWLLQYNHLFTKNRYYQQNDIHTNNQNIPIFDVERGGKYTYHGPNQLIGYIILNLQRKNITIQNFVFNVEEVLILTLKQLNIKAFRKDGLIGIWVNENGEDKKIAAIGIYVKKWVTQYGFSLNLDTDLQIFKTFTPCGITKYGVTNLKNFKKNLDYTKIQSLIIKNFKAVFNYE